MRLKGVGKDPAGDNPSQFKRILLDSKQLILSAQKWHVIKKSK
jgi:hypothetical protein